MALWPIEFWMATLLLAARNDVKYDMPKGLVSVSERSPLFLPMCQGENKTH